MLGCQALQGREFATSHFIYLFPSKPDLFPLNSANEEPHSTFKRSQTLSSLWQLSTCQDVNFNSVHYERLKSYFHETIKKLIVQWKFDET